MPPYDRIFPTFPSYSVNTAGGYSTASAPKRDLNGTLRRENFAYVLEANPTISDPAGVRSYRPAVTVSQHTIKIGDLTIDRGAWVSLNDEWTNYRNSQPAPKTLQLESY